MADLGELLERELQGATERVELTEQTVNFGDLAGPEHAAERSEWAELLSGTRNRSSRAYLSQRRNVERWVKGRTPKVITVQRIVDVIDAAAKRRRRLRTNGGAIRIRMKFYAGRKPETLPPHRWLVLSPGAMADVIHRHDQGDKDGAGLQLWTDFLKTYGVPNIGDWLRSAEVLDLTIEPL